MRSRAAAVAGNAVSILASEAVNRATTFGLYALVGRSLGPRAFGQLSLAIGFFYTSNVLAAAGLKTLLTREVARDRDDASRYLRAGAGLALASATGAFVILAVTVMILDYARDTTVVILVLALALFPYSQAAVCEGVFQATERMIYIAAANVPVNVAKLLLAIVLLGRGAGVQEIALVIVLGHLAALVVEWWFMARSVARPHPSADLQFSLELARQTVPFLGIDGLVALMATANIFLLSRLASEVEIGLYSAASQLMVPVALTFTSVVLSVFPIMVRRSARDPEALAVMGRALVRVLLVLAVPTAVGLCYIADDALLLLYGEQGFLRAAPVLRVMAWTLIPIALSTAMGQVLFTQRREHTIVRILVVDALVAIVLGAVLISWLGVIGAGVAALATRLVDVVLHHLTASRLIPGMSVLRLSWQPSLASLVMVAIFVLIGLDGTIATIAVGVATYGTALLVLELLAAGGPRQLRRRCAMLRGTT